MGTDYLHIDRDWGAFVGSFDNNLEHSHYAIQLSIPLIEEVQIECDRKIISSSKPLLVRSTIKHRLVCNGSHLLLLFNPVSVLGHYFKNSTQEAITVVENELVSKLHKLALLFSEGSKNRNDFTSLLIEELFRLSCDCLNSNHMEDGRIGEAIDYLSQHIDRVVPLTEIADVIALSPSRFLHLFKEQTGITYRRAQLWSKISTSLTALQGQTITETAHQFGFADSAHYSKIFKENFGFSPRQFLKLSQFIQV